MLRRAGNLLLIACVLQASGLSAATGAKGLRSKPLRVTRSGRIVASVPMNYRLSIGLNYQSYIFEAAIHKGDTVTELVKLSYRFHQREPEIPAKFLDYSILHTFRMTRDQSCDESWSSLSNRYFFDSSGAFRGKTSDLVYSEHASTPKMTDASILPCYVVTPADYRASAKKPLTENARLQIAAK